MRIVIADDEPLLRYHLRSLLSEIDPSAELLEAENGLELAALVGRGGADAAFVDIRMPKLDGLEAMRRLTEEGTEIPWAVLSSYSEFDYAKRALEMGALGYALKPPSAEEIRSILPALKAAVRRKRVEGAQAFARSWAGMEEAAERDEPPHRMRSGIFIHDGPPAMEDAAGSRFSAGRLSERALADERNRLRAASVPGRYPGSHELICAAEGGSPEGADAVLAAFLNTAFAAARRDEGKGDAGRSLCIISPTVGSMEEGRERLRSIRELLDFRSLLPSGVLEYEKAAALLLPFSAPELKAAKETARIIREAGGEDGNAYSAAAVDLQAALAPIDPSARRRLVRYLEQVFGIELGSGETGEETWKQALRTGLAGLFRAPGPDGDLVASVVNYLSRHFHERITIAEVASVFALSPNYLSTLFHARTGKTLLEHLTELRLERGRELLRAGKPVKECAWTVGYGSERHFAQLYRRRFGYPPAAEKDGRNQKS